MQIKYASKKHLKCLHIAAPLLLAFFLLISNTQVLALKQTSDLASNTVRVKSSSIAFGTGNSGTSTFSSTQDYSSTTVTAGLTFNETANAVTATLTAPSTGNSLRAGFTSQTTGTTAALSTTVANEIIYVVVSILGTNNVASITNSGTALTWTKRAALNDGSSERVETWYAIAASAASRTITVNFASRTTFMVIAFGIRNANTASPFDSSTTLPTTATGTGTTPSTTVSTTNPNDYLIGALAVSVPSGNAPNPAKVGSYTLIQGNHQSSVGAAAESLSVTSIQTGTTVSFSTSSSVSWSIIGDAVKGVLATGTVNSGFSSPSSTGSVTVANGVSAFIWSPAYPRATTVYAGSWLLDLWALAASSDVLNVILASTDSSYSITDLAFSGSTVSIGTSKSETKTTIAGSQLDVPSGGHIVVILTNLAGGAGSFTVYWGTGQVTNLKTPSVHDYVLQIVNSAAASYSVSFSSYSFSSIAKLTNFTIYVYSPTTKCVAINNGAFTQTNSPTLTLSGTSTFYFALNASASDFNTVSNIVILMRFNSSKPFSNSIINFTVN
jgi:hypothetical protein